jgi:hypothetical protein
MELKTTEVRRELAEKLPRLSKRQGNDAAAGPGKKTTARRRKRRQRLQQNTNPTSE